MPSKKGKAKVSQADLRKMMQDMKNKKGRDGSTKTQTNQHISSLKRPKMVEPNLKQNYEPKRVKIDSAAISSTAVKSSAIKPTQKAPQKVNNPSILTNKTGYSMKRPHVNTEETMNEIAKPVPSKLQKVKHVKNQSLSTPLGLGAYSDSESSDEETKPITPAVTSVHSSAAGSSHNNTTSKSNTPASLPAGFFDDPETDAKIRGEETPADKMDREWESFQKEVQHETGHSEQIIDEDQETGHLDREIDEIDSQIQYYHLVDKLCDEKDNTLHKIKHIAPKNKNQSHDEDTGSSSDEDDSLLDWREKDAFS